VFLECLGLVLVLELKVLFTSDILWVFFLFIKLRKVSNNVSVSTFKVLVSVSSCVKNGRSRSRLGLAVEGLVYIPELGFQYVNIRLAVGIMLDSDNRLDK
jgi:hypothetical protein